MDLSSLLAKLREHRTKVVLGVIAAVVVLFVIIIGGSWNGTQKDGVRRETTLTAQYLDNQNVLSAFLNTVHEQFQISNVKAAKLDQILTDAVKGRYQGDTTASPSDGKLFSAIREAYPDLSGLDVFDRLQDTISAGRSEYKGVQSKLLDMLREYDRWRRSGIIHSKVVSLVGFPSGDLEARIPGVKTFHGKEARDQMYNIVLSEETTNTYSTGHSNPIDFGG